MAESIIFDIEGITISCDSSSKEEVISHALAVRDFIRTRKEGTLTSVWKNGTEYTYVVDRDGKEVKTTIDTSIC